MIRSATIITFIAMVLVTSPASAQYQPPARTLSLTFAPDGLVTLSAASVSVREVLQEWARQCGCLIANAQNIQGTLDVPVQFERQPQEVVLASLLKRAAGYVLTRRSARMTGPSDFETIFVLPTSSATAATSPYAPPASAYAPVPAPTYGSPAEELPPITPIVNTLPRDPNTQPGAQPPGSVTTAQRPPAATSGTRSVFVPIVPIGANETARPAAPATPAPGAPTNTPGTIPPPQTQQTR
jgi:hypothetical protein